MGRLNPTAATRPARGLGGPQPRACSAGSPPPAPASRRRVPPAPAPASCGAAHPGRAGLASERPRSARRAGQDEQGRKGRAPHRLGPPPPAEEGPSRAGSTTARASQHPPQRAPAAPEPEAGPSLVPAHAAPHSQSPQRRQPARAVPPLTFLRRLCPAPLACKRPSGLQTNSNSPLLHKREGGAWDGNCRALAHLSPSRPLSRCGLAASPLPLRCVTSGLRAVVGRVARQSPLRSSLTRPGLGPAALVLPWPARSPVRR